MGGSSSPVKAIVKAVSDVSKTVDKGATDVFGKEAGGFIKDATGISALQTGAKAGTDVLEQAGRLDKIILSPTNAKEEAAKDAARADQQQREQAVRDQNEADANLRKQNASNADATRGSSIILGNKKKKGKKGGSVSSGMGLSKGKTGLQT